MAAVGLRDTMVNIKHPVPFFRRRSYTVHLVQGLNLHWMIPLSFNVYIKTSGRFPFVTYMVAYDVHIVNTIFAQFYVFYVLHNKL